MSVHASDLITQQAINQEYGDVELLDFQKPCVTDLVSHIQKENNILLIGATGTGKTYILGATIRRLIDNGHIDTNRKFPIMFITAASVIRQTEMVLYTEFKIPPNLVLVTNYDSLRATIGGIWLEWNTRIIHGAPTIEPSWKKDFKPQLIIADECQKCKNPDTQQSLILTAASKDTDIQCIYSSATPFTRVSEAKCIALALRPKIKVYAGEVEVTETLWPSFAKQISGVKDPTEFNNEACKRMTAALEHKIVRVANVKFKHRTFIKCKLVQFLTQEDRNSYDDAYEEYLEILRKTDRDEPGGVAKIWVAMLKFRMKAELLRAPILAEACHLGIMNGKQVGVCSNFIETLNAVRNSLLGKYGYKESDISTIVGGQSLEERQTNINNYQRGISKICLFTLKSGGVGLSLHHNPKNEKRTRPRELYLPPTWSAIELVQGLGRMHRINSVSTTYQYIVWFDGTIEALVAAKVSRKLSCLKEIVGKKESWTEAFTPNDKKDLDNNQEIKQLEDKEALDVDEDHPEGEEFATEAFEQTKEDEALDKLEDKEKEELCY